MTSTSSTFLPPPQQDEAILFSASNYNEVANKYESIFGVDQGLHDMLNRFIELLSSPPCTVLDCGSGTGKPVAATIVASGRSVYGIDSSENMIEISRRQVGQGATFHLADMLEFQPPASILQEGSLSGEAGHQGGFGGIVATLSLFSLTRAQITSLARKWHSWLQPGGYVLLCTFGAEDVSNATPEMYDADGQCASEVPWTFMHRTVLITMFTRQGWVDLFEKEVGGFEVVVKEARPFVPGKESGCDEEMHWFLIARKK